MEEKPLRTLQLHFPLGHTLFLAIIILAVIGIVAELIVRLSSIQDRLAPPTLGMNVRELDLKLQVMDEIDEEQAIDCIVLGSSETYRGIDPVILEQSYQRVTDQSLNCFNLGVPTIVTSGMSELLDYVVQRYHPKLIILGLTPREISGDVLSWSKTQETILEWDWLRFQLEDDFSVQGWLYSHSKTYGYYKTYSEIYRDIWLSDSMSLRTRRKDYATFLNQKGFRDRQKILKIPLTRGEQRRLSKAYGGFFLAESELAGLNRILAHHSPPETSVVLVEIPINPVIISDFLGEERYTQFKTTLQQAAAAHNTPLVFTTELNLIPDDGWADSNHMNMQGAPVFSEWLGEQLGTLANETRLTLDH